MSNSVDIANGIFFEDYNDAGETLKYMEDKYDVLID